MKIFVTVGTTSFDPLIRYVDECLAQDEDVLMQTGPGSYQPSRHKSFEFTQEIERHYQEADVVISHCGAGSTYRLLEMEKTLILVPNLTRVDKHQSDLARFMEQGNYAHVAWKMEDIAEMLALIRTGKHSLSPYESTPFSATERLHTLIAQALKP